MCVIVDANIAWAVFGSPPTAPYLPVIQWLGPKQHGCLVYGGKLATELLKVESARNYLLQLRRAGRAKYFNDEIVDDEEAIVREMSQCKSNDSHVIALARISGARTLCSEDEKLQRDFKNRALISDPPGKIYYSARKIYSRPHEHLLKHTRSCPYKGKR